MLQTHTEINGTEFIFESCLRTLTVSFDADTACTVRNVFKNNSAKELLFYYSCRLINDSTLIMQSQISKDSIAVLNKNLSKPCSKQIKKKKWVSTTDGDDGFVPCLDTLKVFYMKKQTYLFHSERHGRYIRHFLFTPAGASKP